METTTPVSPKTTPRPADERANNCPGDQDKAESRVEGGANFATSLGMSPHVSSETAHDDHHEQASFSLFNASFDTISDPGGVFALVNEDTILTPTNHGRKEHVLSASDNDRRHSTKADLNLPELKTQQEKDSSDLSLGDISPIKMVYSNTSTGISFQAGSSNLKPLMSQAKNAFSPSVWPDNQSEALVVPTDWNQEGSATVAHRSNPFFVIRSSRQVFKGLKYLLPCLLSMDCQVNMSNYGSVRQYKGKKGEDDNVSSDLRIAIRRVEAAICAFGGTLNSNRNHQTWSIFRLKDASSEARRLYEQRLHHRYYLSGSQISWDVEQDPPIHIGTKESSTKGLMAPRKKTAQDSDDDSRVTNLPSASPERASPANKTTSMKYRCKMCGQLKQNHNCPYQQSFQRSIGTMVYAAVNSYSAAEPGVIAPSVTTMNNNLVSYDSDHGSPKAGYTSGPISGNSKQGSVLPYAAHASSVTPDTLRGSTYFHSPQSSLSAQSSEDPMTACQPQVPSKAVAHGMPTQNTSKGATMSSRGSKRSHDQLVNQNSPGRAAEMSRHAPFVASVTLHPEQYRAVTPSTSEVGKKETDTSYQYPAMPLTFAERKRLSDTLFFLSKEIPAMTSDCAAILHHARENNEWDLAVAELLTQVVVGLYCGEGDLRLEGLQQYLLALGIAC